MQNFSDISNKLTFAKLNESEQLMEVDLSQHRGEPDPQKVKQRQEAHERGLERHENALKRQQEAQQRRKEKERLEKLNNLETAGENKQNLPVKSKEQIKQISNKVKQAIEQTKKQREQQKQQNIQDVQYQQIKNQQQNQQQKQKKFELVQTNANKAASDLEQEMNDAVASAPTDNTKEVTENFNKEIKQINYECLSNIENTDNKEKIKKKKEIQDKYEEALKKAENNLKSAEEKSYIRKVASSKVLIRAEKAFEAWWELFGYKDITDDISAVAKKYFGIGIEKEQLQRQAKEKDSKHIKKVSEKTIKNLGKNKEKRLKELEKQGYTRSEAEDILTEMMQKHVGKNETKIVKQQKQHEQKQKQTEEKRNKIKQDSKKKESEEKTKESFNPNNIGNLRDKAKDAGARDILSKRIKDRTKIEAQYVKEGLSPAAAKRKWYKETENLIS